MKPRITLLAYPTNPTEPGRHITGAEVQPDGRTVIVTFGSDRRTTLWPSRRAREFAAAVNRYARPEAEG